MKRYVPKDITISERVLTWLYIQDPHSHLYHPTSIPFIIYNLHILSYDGCICVQSILNIFVAYTTFGRYIGIRASSGPTFGHQLVVNCVAVVILTLRYQFWSFSSLLLGL